MASKGKAYAAGTILGGALGSGIGAVAGALWVKSQAHWKADEWVQNYQNPWGEKAIGLFDRVTKAREAGTLTYADIVAAQDEFETNVQAFWDDAKAFGIKGGDYERVTQQAHTKLDPIISQWRTDL